MDEKRAMMAGIYIHIPFCKKACSYCNFHFSTALGSVGDMVAAIIREAELRRDYLEGRTVETIYFGGGTPSLLNSSQLTGILQALRSIFPVAADAEITLEANPDDLDENKLKELKDMGIGRISIGVQSLRDSDLTAMNRSHDAAQAIRSLQLAKDAGFSRISADLIYGLPSLSDDRLAEEVAVLAGLHISHLSCYALTVEPSTALHHQISTGRTAPVDPDHAARQFELLHAQLGDAGYDHYEISNFCLPGHASQHNGNYWKEVPYLGLGASAHSFNGTSRQWNISHNALYMKAIEKGILSAELELLTSVQRFNEYLLVSFRTREGVDLGILRSRWGEGAVLSLLRTSEKYLRDGLIIWENQRLRMTVKGWLLADGITGALFQTG
jgi:putative oxygen-independent coproporphyrinogen III oxidase